MRDVGTRRPAKSVRRRTPRSAASVRLWELDPMLCNRVQHIIHPFANASPSTQSRRRRPPPLCGARILVGPAQWVLDLPSPRRYHVRTPLSAAGKRAARLSRCASRARSHAVSVPHSLCARCPPSCAPSPQARHADCARRAALLLRLCRYVLGRSPIPALLAIPHSAASAREPPPSSTAPCPACSAPAVLSV